MSSSPELDSPRFIANVHGPEGTFVAIRTATKRGTTEVVAECIVTVLPHMVKILKKKLGPSLESHIHSSWWNSNVELHLVISCREDESAVDAVTTFIPLWMDAVQSDINARNASKFDGSTIMIEGNKPAHGEYHGKRNKEGNDRRRDNRRRIGSLR